MHIPAYAQDDIGASATNSFRYGPKAGINIANLYNNTGATGVADLGYGGGGFAYYRIIPLVGASVELRYLQMGSNNYQGTSFYTNDLDGGSDLITHNIDAPVLAHVYLPVGGPIEFKGIVGSAFTYNFYSVEKSVQYMSLNGVTYLPVETVTNRTGDFNPFEIALLTGIGADIPMNNLLLTADIRYRWGFYNATDIVTGGDVNGDNNVWNAIQISVGVGF